jgi:hypothetical protein
VNSESPSMGSENTWNYIGEFLSSLQFTVLFSVLYVFVLISNMVLDIFPVSQPGFCDVLPPLGGACCSGLPERLHHAFPLELAAFWRGGTSCSCNSPMMEDAFW